MRTLRKGMYLPSRSIFSFVVLLLLSFLVSPSIAAPFLFSTGNPDGKMGTVSRPGTTGPEIESADDFVLSSTTTINAATFTGLIPLGTPTADIVEVIVEIYRVFPMDSDVGRTGGPPTFSTPQVPTRVNSPSDVALTDRNSMGSSLTFNVNVLNPSFTVGNSVLNGINPLPNQTTLGEGPVTGQEVQFTVAFATPVVLPADHYFFVPQVEVTGGAFFWLSAPKPVVAPGTPFAPDLQSWIRDDDLAPDWLRVGTDIVGGNAFNAAFSLQGETVPEPETIVLLGLGLAGLAVSRKCKQA